MEYELISHRVNSFEDAQLRQFENQVERYLEAGWTLLGGAQVSQLPNGYQITQAVTRDDSE